MAKTPLPRLTGAVLAQRYRITDPLGEGGHGQVWLAYDQVLRQEVAIKLLPTVTPQQRVRARREIAMLRRLQVPGVVPLRDEGEFGPRTFLVMDVIVGEGFPDKRHTWPALAPPTVALLETLARIHAVGVVHRDLKPGNVLVAHDGRPTLLDFGISWDEFDDSLTRTGQILGTPAYLAPEQVDGGPISPRTDLYALGVMLYEALAGEHPYGVTDAQTVLCARALGPPMPLGRRVMGVPPAVCAVVDALLSPDPADRPRSAYDVLTQLRGEPAALAVTRGPLPWLDTPAVDALLHHVEAGRSVALVGPPGVGRTSVLRRLADALVERGGKVLWATPSSRPFGSLEALLGSLDDLHDQPLAAAAAAVCDGIRGLLHNGAVLLVDDAAEVDPPSARVIAGCLDAGAVVQVVEAVPASAPPATAVVRLHPFAEQSLRGLFAGPSRLFHIPEDAAEALYARTDGVASRVAEELHAWVRAGLGRWQGDQIVVDPVDLATIRHRAGALRLASAHDRVSPDPLGALGGQLGQLLRWIQLAWPHATLPLLQRVSGEARWRLEATLSSLVQTGALRCDPHGAYTLRVSPPAEALPQRQRAAAHLTLAEALPPGAAGRLQHLLAGAPTPWTPGFAAKVLAEAEARVQPLVLVGGLREALGALGEAVGALRVMRDDPETDPAMREESLDAEFGILGRLVELSLVDCTPPVLDRALYALSLYPRRDDAVRALEALLHAGRALRQAGEESLHRAEALSPFADPGLERRRLGLWVMAHTRSCPEREAEVIDHAVALVRAANDPESSALAHLWQARPRYRAGQFAEAARICEEAPPAAWATTRIELLVFAASASMEAFDLANAVRLAQQALEAAAAIRHPYLEARAERVLRAAAYRAGDPLRPDPVLLAASEHLQTFNMEALLLTTEAAIAWRNEEWLQARDLALRGRDLWASAAWPVGELLCDCLAVASSPGPLLPQWDSLVPQAMALLPHRTAAECLGLLGTVQRLPEVARKALQAWAEGVPREHWGQRMDVLTVDEILTPRRQLPNRLVVSV